MKINKIRLTQRFKFFIERHFIKGPHYQLLFVAALIGFISVLGGILVLPTGEPLNNLGESTWWAFLRLSDPGYLGDDEGAWRRFVSTIITIAGYVVFLGSMVAIITTWLNTKMRNLEQGLTPVTADNHILILGWTNRTVHIAGELFQSVGRVKRFLQKFDTTDLNLIILSDDVTPRRLQELKDNRLIGEKADEIILRSGTPLDREHLRRVDSMNAAAIIIPSHSSRSEGLILHDVETIKILLSLNEHPDKTDDKPLPYVVAEIQDERKVKAAKRAYSGPLEVIASDTIISRLIAQNIRHPGLSEIYKELLSRSINNNIFIREYPEFTSRSFGDIKAFFPNAVVLGIVRPERTEFVPYLNISSTFKINEADRLVLLARHYNDSEINDDPPTEISTGIIGTKSTKNNVENPVNVIDKKILILGWNHRIPALINEFGTYTGENYSVDIFALRDKKEREKAIQLVGGFANRVECRHIEADYVTEPELELIDPAIYDNIIMVSSDRFEEDEEADARTIVGYILVEDMIKESGKYPQILLELSDPNNETLIGNHREEVIISPMILSHLLSQIAVRRELHSIYNELFTVGGPEIIFKSPSDYGIQKEQLSFSEIESIVSNYSDTALGIYKIPHSSKRKGLLILNPSRDEILDIGKDVQLVVITTID